MSDILTHADTRGIYDRSHMSGRAPCRAVIEPAVRVQGCQTIHNKPRLRTMQRTPEDSERTPDKAIRELSDSEMIRATHAATDTIMEMNDIILESIQAESRTLQTLKPRSNTSERRKRREPDTGAIIRDYFAVIKDMDETGVALSFHAGTDGNHTLKATFGHLSVHIPISDADLSGILFEVAVRS